MKLVINYVFNFFYDIHMNQSLLAITILNNIIIMNATENAIYEYTKDIAILAYNYGYAPMTQQVLMANDLTNKAPMNTIYYTDNTSTASNQIFSGPNSDTVYATAWLDLTNTPIFIVSPKIKHHNMWYTIQLLDIYTNTIENLPGVNKRNKSKFYLIVGPNTNKKDIKIEPHISIDTHIIESPTNIVYMVARVTVLNHDVDFACTVLNTIKMNPMYNNANVLELSPYSSSIYTSLDFYKNLLKLINYNPPTSEQTTMINLLKSIGLNPDIPTDPETLSSTVKQALLDAIPIALSQIIPYGYLFSPGSVTSNYWLGGTQVGIYGNNFLRRNFFAYGGSASNVPIEQTYLTTTQDTTGQLLNGNDHNYKIHFNTDGSNYPKTCNGFWSITLYVNASLVQGFNLQLYDNEFDKYAVGTNNNDLILNGDGSLDIYIQHIEPSDPIAKSNWLPCPTGIFRLLFRIYSATINQIYHPTTPGVEINDS